MVHSRKIMLFVVCIASSRISQATLTNTLARVTGGITVVAGYKIANEMISHNARLQDVNVTDIVTNPSTVLAGIAVSLPFSTYGRSLRAQWNLWWWTNEKLLAVAMEDYDTDAQLVDALSRYYACSKYSLIEAHEELASKCWYLERAISLIEAVIDDLPEDSDRAEECEEWLDDVCALRDRVQHALTAIAKDPRWVELLKAKNMEIMNQIMSRPSVNTHVVYNFNKK